MTPGLLEFYLLGRDNPLSDLFDFEALARRVLHGESVRDVSRAAAADAASSLRNDDARKKWGRKKDVRDAFDELELPVEAAFNSYLDGAIDQTAYDMEPDILEALDALLEDEGVWVDVVEKTSAPA